MTLARMAPDCSVKSTLDQEMESKTQVSKIPFSGRAGLPDQDKFLTALSGMESGGLGVFAELGQILHHPRVYLRAFLT
jgi:hypothetical protein